MEEQITFNEAPKESFFKKIKRLIFSSSAYWIHGGKIGLFTLFLFFLICLITAPIFIGLGLLELFTENILNPMSRDITGIDLSTNTGGWFSFDAPSIFGWLYLSIVFFLAGSFIGSLLDIIKKRIIIPPVFIVLFGLLFGTYLFLAHFVIPPFKCSLMFDGNSDSYYQPKSACLLNFVTSNNNITDSIICDNLNENRYDSKKSRCFSVIAKRTGDPKYCDHIPENTENRLKEQCYSTLGKEYKNISLCKSGSSEIDDKCLTNVAIGQDNYSICEQISSTKEKDNCYINFSFKYHDLNLCEKINDAGEKEGCVKFSRYDDSYITLSIPEYYTYNQESSNYKDLNCPSEVNIFLRRAHDNSGTFIGKIFACKDDIVRSNGLYLNKEQKILMSAKNKIIGKYDFAIYQGYHNARRIYLTRPNGISISAIIDYPYHSASIAQNAILDFENFISKIYIKDSPSENNINKGNWQLSNSYKISQNQANYVSAGKFIKWENKKLSFEYNENDFNIEETKDGTIHLKDKNTSLEYAAISSYIIQNQLTFDMILNNTKEMGSKGGYYDVTKKKIGSRDFVAYLLKWENGKDGSMEYETVINGKHHLQIGNNFFYHERDAESISKIEKLIESIWVKNY